MSDLVDAWADAIGDEDIRTLEDLLRSGVIPSAESRYSIFEHLCQRGWVEGMRAVLTCRPFIAKLNEFDEFSWTPLMHAVRSGSQDLCKLLLESGADVNAHDEARAGNTALSEAVD